MLFNNQRIQRAIAGLIGGAVGWILIELLFSAWLDSPAESMLEVFIVDLFFGALVGLSIGAALGVAEGLILGSRYQAQRGALIGAGIGLIAGAIGLLFGEMVYQALSFLGSVGRALGWAVFGAILGTAEGIRRKSSKGIRSAALGGLIGGAIGGLMFDLVGYLTATFLDSGAFSRAVTLMITGLSIGLWIALIERILAPATLKIISSGRFEGREFLLDKPELTVGTNERGDIVILDDSQILAHHASLLYQNDHYLIQAEGSARVLVNGKTTTRQSLAHEDELEIGQTRFIYRNKEEETAIRTGRLSNSVSVASAPPAQTNQPQIPPRSVQPSPPLEPFPSTPVAPATIPGDPPTPPYQAPISSATDATLPLIPSPLHQPAPPSLWLMERRTDKRHPIRPDLTTIGRREDNHIILNDPTVSGYHAEIRHENGHYVLYDKESSNGTFVKGRPITAPTLLKEGWIVRIGEFEMMVKK